MSPSDMPPSDTSSGTRRPRYSKDLPPKENHPDEAVRDEIERRERLILPLARLRAAKK